MAKGLDIMRITISGRNIELTDGLKAAVEDKIGKLEKYFTPDTDVFVTLSVEKERQKIEVTIPVPGHIIRSEQVSNDMYVSIDLVEEIIVRQLRKYKTRIANQQNSRKNFQPPCFFSISRLNIKPVPPMEQLVPRPMRERFKYCDSRRNHRP